MTGTLLGLLVLALMVIALINDRQSRNTIILCSTALSLVIVAGLLGGLTVLTDLVWWIRLVHLTIAQFLIAILTLILWHTASPVTQSSRSSAFSSPRGWKWKTGASLAIIFLLIISGSYMVGVGAGGSCASWPLCRGSLIPDGFVYAVHMGHRYIAVFATVFLAYVALTFIIRGRTIRPLKRTAHLALGLMGLQLIVGALTVWSGFSVHLRVTHLSIATLVWMGTVLMAAAATAAFGNNTVDEHDV